VSTASRSWTAGSFIAIGIVLDTTSVGPVCTLTSNSAPVLVVNVVQSTTLATRLFYIKNVVAVTDVITCTWSGTHKSAIIASEYASVDTVDLLDVSASASGTGGNPTCGTTATTNVPNEVVIGVLGVANNPGATAGAGFTLRATDQATTSPEIDLEDKVVAAVGTQSAAFTSAANQNVCITVTFKQATSAPPTSTGPSFTGTGADNNAVGTLPWDNPTRIQVSDNSYATAATASTDVAVVTHYLKATNFGFVIPPGATITGIKVEFERFRQLTSVGACTTSSSLTDSTVKLVLSGSVSGNNRAVSGNWSTVEAFVPYGGQNDLWGATIAVSDANASTSGVVITIVHTGCDEFSPATGCDPTQPIFFPNCRDQYFFKYSTPNVDSVRMTVYYTVAGAGGTNKPRRRVIQSQTRTAPLVMGGS